MKCLAALAVLLTIPSIASGQSCAPGSVPSIEAKGNEARVDDNDLLQKQCAPLAFERFKLPDMRPAKVDFYHSAEWGDVARVDVGNSTAPKYWRFVCFKKDKDSKVKTAIYDLKNGSCYAPPESREGYWTIYPPLSR
jgi:hypothetical protein